MDKKSLTAAALFSGIGGFCEGLRRVGVKTKWANEYDEQACRTYRENFRDTRLIEKDVQLLTVQGDELEPVDILTAGFPCQSFSQAGQRKGFEDDRGRLFFEIIRLIKEFGANRPKVLLFENAPYLRYGQGGAWLLRISDEIKKAGYWFREANAFELDLAEQTGIPQQRSRLFLVAFSTEHFRSGRLDALDAQDVPAEGLSSYIDFEGEQDPRYYLSEENRYYKMIKKEKLEIQKHGIYQLRKYLVRSKTQGLCPTLTANMGAGGHNVPFIWDRRGLRKLTEFECLRLQGFRGPPEFTFPDDLRVSKRYLQIGNAVPPPLVSILGRAIQKKLAQEEVKI